MAESVTKVAPARTRLSCLRVRVKDDVAGAEVEEIEEEGVSLDEVATDGEEVGVADADGEEELEEEGKETEFFTSRDSSSLDVWTC